MLRPISSGYLDVILKATEQAKQRRQMAIQQLANTSARATSRPTTGQTQNLMHWVTGGSNVRPAPMTGNRVTDWINQAGSVMGRQFSPDEIRALATIIQRESSGNPNAINRWDSNARAGHPSQGLMQTIPSTFKAYAMPGYNTNITDPISNIIAGVRYLQGRYGGILNHPGLRNMSRGGGYRGY